MSALPLDDEMLQAAYRWIDSRNEQLLSSVRAPPATRHVIVETLDGMLQTPMSGDLPTKYWSTTHDRNNLVRTTLEWGTRSTGLELPKYMLRIVYYQPGRISA